MKLKRTGSAGVISGILLIKNVGFRNSAAGAIASIGLYNVDPADTYNPKYQTTLVKSRLPSIKKGKTYRLPFASKALSIEKFKINSGDYLIAEVKNKGKESYFSNNSSTVSLD